MALVSEKTFTFTDPEDENKMVIHVPEVIDADYGMYVWPCAPVIAQYIWYHRKTIKGKHILELGAGTALPGVLAAKLGAVVTLSDSSELPKCLENCQKTANRNGVQSRINVIPITWGEFNHGLISLDKVDIILASDCFYDTKDFEDVLITVAYLISKNSEAEFWSTYQVRSSNRSLVPLLLKWNLICTHVPLKDFDADDAHLAGSTLPGDHTIEMLIIKKKQSCSDEHHIDKASSPQT